MDKIMIIVVILMGIIPVIIFLRFLDLGIGAKSAIKLTLKFPYEIVKIHLYSYNMVKNENKTVARRILLAPIVDLPQVIISYAEMYIEMEAKILAITELLNELDDKDIRKMTKILKKQGITIRRKKIRDIDKTTDDKSLITNYLGNIGFDNVASLC